MCESILKDDNLLNSMNKLLDEEYHSQTEEFLLGLVGHRGMQNAAYPKLARLLHSVASMGRVVIIGYGGFQGTRDLPGGIDVRLVALCRYAPVAWLTYWARAKRLPDILLKRGTQSAGVC